MGERGGGWELGLAKCRHRHATSEGTAVSFLCSRMWFGGERGESASVERCFNWKRFFSTRLSSIGGIRSHHVNSQQQALVMLDLCPTKEAASALISSAALEKDIVNFGRGKGILRRTKIVPGTEHPGLRLIPLEA